MGKKKSNLSKEEALAQALVPESEWPYQVPGNWVWTRLGCITKVIGGGTPPSNVMEYYEDGDIPWISPVDLSGYNEVYIERGKKSITELGLSKSSARMLPIDTVLLSSRAPIGYVAIASNELTTNQGFKSCLPSPVYQPKYLYYYLKNSKELLESYASGTTFLELSGSKAEKVEFPLPPLAEQQRIVDRIESLFEKLDQAKGLIQDALDSFENRKAAILHKAFSGELTKKWREENGVGMESWETLKLGQCGNWYGGGTPSKSRSDYWENGNIPWVSPKDMKSMFIDNAIDKITQTAVNESSTRIIPEGAILIVVRSGILRRILPIALTRVQVTLNQDMKALIPIGINAKYLYWLFVSKEASIRTECAKSGTTVESISSELLYDYDITLPSIAEQVEIAQILDDIFENEINARMLTDVTEDVDEMKKSILARAFRGELGTNDIKEENSISLLFECISCN